MNSEFTKSLPTQIGNLKLEFHLQCKELKLLSLSISKKSSIRETPESTNINSNNKVAEAIVLQLKNYFSSAISFQSVSTLPAGTVFQRLVWNELCKIPVGETRTYGDIAKNLNSSARAVGNACRRNPIQIIVPCHRVISATGIGGYAGKTDGRQLEIKRWLLRHEGVEL